MWGNQPIYLVGMLRNIELAKLIYPDWEVVIYHDSSVPKQNILQLEQAGATTIDVSGSTHGLFWRFYAADLPDCGYAIFRDADSRLSKREKMAVDEWIRKGKSLHIMRDHPYHAIPDGSDRPSILGGMWGIKGNLLPIRKMIEEFSKDKELGYAIDQTFLVDIYTRFEKDAVIHDEFVSK